MDQSVKFANDRLWISLRSLQMTDYGSVCEVCKRPIMDQSAKFANDRLWISLQSLQTTDYG